MDVSTVMPSTQEEFQEEMKALPQKRLDYLAEVAKHDLYVMSRGVLGYPDVNPKTHKALCNFLQEDEPEKKIRVTLMPRIHLKTTIALANKIRRAVKQPDVYQGLIVGETETKSTVILDEIKAHWQKNDTLRMLYPQLVPTKFSGPGSDWSATRASIIRSAILKQATWTAVGVGGAAVGGHWTHITADDIIGLEAYESEAVMKRVKNYVDGMDSLLVNAITDLTDFVGTRWSRNDVYAYIMRLFAGNLLVFRREAIEDGEPIFPQKHSLKTLAAIMERPWVWFAQYCNNPIAQGQTDFPSGAVRTFSISNSGEIAAVKDGAPLRWKRDQLDIVMLCDPNSGSVTAPDDAAVVVTAEDVEENVFVLETKSGRPTPSEYVDWIFDLYQKWQPRAVGIEKAGQQTTMHYFEKKCREMSVWPVLVDLKPKNRDKIKRIRTSMEPILRSRRLFALPSQTTLRSQIEFFPDNELFDVLDALSYGSEDGMWQKPDSYEEQEERRGALTLLVNRRNKRTGY